MRSHFNERFQAYLEPVAVSAVIALLLLSSYASYRNLEVLKSASVQVDRANQFLVASEQLESAVKDAETGQRGYLITGEEPYLEPYHEAVLGIDDITRKVVNLMKDDVELNGLTEDLEILIAVKMKELDESIDLRRRRGFEPAMELVKTDVGKKSMDDLRDILDQIRDSARNRLATRSGEAEITYWKALLTGLVTTIAGLFLVGLIVYLLNLNQRQRDIEFQKQQESTRFLGNIVNSLGEAVAVLDINRNVVLLNKVFGDMLHVPGHEQVGNSFLELDDGAWNLDTVTKLISDAIKDPGQIHRQELAHEFPRLGPKVLRLNSKFLEMGGTRPNAVLLVVNDITEERTLEIKNQIQDQHMRWFLEQIHDYAIFTMDPECRATSWNRGVSQVLGFSEEEFIGQDVRELIFTPEAKAAGIDVAEFETAKKHGHASDDRWMMRKGGEKFWASGMTNSTRDDAGRLIGYCKVMRDMTRQKLAQDELTELAAQLSEVDRRKNEFLATLAHELRNPLAPIKNAVQLMGMSELDEEVANLRSTMERQVDQLVRLIDDLLDISRISRGKVKLRNEIIDLRPIIDAAVEASGTFIQEKQQHLLVNVEADDQPIYVDADASRMTQIVTNLLNNSSKYSHADSRIELRCWQDHGLVYIRVTDNGIGIEPERLEDIFQMFEQVNDSLERGESGLGIGLTLVRTLTELHGGTVTARSDGVGHGSEFTVAIPAAPPPEHAAVPNVSDAEPLEIQPRRVLVVDDMRALRSIVAKLLTRLGHEVETAEGGELALVKLDTFRPEVIISDISMPGMTGYELARRIRQKKNRENILLVAMTGYGQEADRNLAFEAGFNEHLIKPVDLEQLQSLFRRHSEGSV